MPGIQLLGIVVSGIILNCMRRLSLSEVFRGHHQRVSKDMYTVNPSSLFAFASAWDDLPPNSQRDVVAITQGALPEEYGADPQHVSFAIDTISGYNMFIDDSLRSYLDDYETNVAEGKKIVNRIPRLEQVFREELNPGYVKHPIAALDQRRPTFPCICVEDEEDEDED